jgi:hypothetical protein
MFESSQKKWFFVLSILVFFSFSSEAQIVKGKANRTKAEKSIVTLKGGALVVRLKTKRNKIEKLKEAIASPNLNNKDKNRLQKELESTIAERDKYNTELVASFDVYYSFSAVYFMYDTSSVALKNGTKSGFLLNKNLEVDSKISITQDSFFVAYTGTLDATDKTGLEALILMDDRFEVLPSPFPYYIRANHFGRVLELIFSPKNTIKRDTKKIVTRLDSNLNEFYKQTIAKRLY